MSRRLLFAGLLPSLAHASLAGEPPAISLARQHEPVVLSSRIEGRFFAPRLCPFDDSIYGIEAVTPTGNHQWIVLERDAEVRELDPGEDRRRRSSEYYGGQIAWCPWSPREGEYWFAFASTGTFGNTDVYLGNTRDAALLRLTTDPGVDWQPAWTPDGDRLVYLAASRNQGDIACLDGMRDVMRSGGTRSIPGPRYLTGGPDADLFPRVSPDGTSIVFSRREEPAAPTGSDLFAIPLDRRDASPVPVSRMPGEETRPSWSPDGRWIAFFYSERLTGARVDLYAGCAPGPDRPEIREARLLASGVEPEPQAGPVWGPYRGDGHVGSILYVGGEGGETALGFVDLKLTWEGGDVVGGLIESDVELVSGLDFSGNRRGLVCGQRDGAYRVYRGSLRGACFRNKPFEIGDP